MGCVPINAYLIFNAFDSGYTFDGNAIILRYNPADDTWTVDLSAPRRATAQVAVLADNGKAYLFGGGDVDTPWPHVKIAALSEGTLGGILDTTPPDITPTVSGTLGSNGWYTSDVTVSWTVTDNESYITAQSGCQTATVTTDTAGRTFTCSATSSGGTASKSVTIKRDATLPTITGNTSPAANSYGWHNSPVLVSFTCNDATSGIATCTSPQTLDEGANRSVNGTVTDNAGNSANTQVTGINVDLTGPVVNVTGVNNGATYTLGAVPAAGCVTTDALSGVQTNATLSLTGGNSNGVGTFTASCTGATDKAGNPGAASVTYQVIYPFTGFFQPVDSPPTINVTKAGAAVPVKFSLGSSYGLAILAVNSPTSGAIACGGGTLDDIEQTVTAGNSSLSYDPTTGQYIYVWKTDKTWSGTCRQFTLTLTDNTVHKAYFMFK
jgi:hypothetical protein